VVGVTFARCRKAGLARVAFTLALTASSGNPLTEFLNLVYGQRPTTDAERDAYDAALYGGEATYEGCYYRATNQMNDEQGPQAHELMDSEEFAPLFEKLYAMWNIVDEEFSDAEADWINCMADAGHPGIERQWAVSGLISEEYQNWAETQFYQDNQAAFLALRSAAEQFSRPVPSN